MDGRGRGDFCPVSTHPANPVITLELTAPRRVRLWSTPCLPSAIRFQFIFIVSKSAESLTAGATESRRRWHLSVWARDVLCLFGVPYERGFNARMACHDADCPVALKSDRFTECYVNTQRFGIRVSVRTCRVVCYSDPWRSQDLSLHGGVLWPDFRKMIRWS